ncbi:tail fiber domain-containing protein [bacterium]|nr:tail fiber domain-containing protein [bacterium]
MKMRLLCTMLILALGTQLALAQMTVKDTDTNVLMQLNDEGTTGSLTFPDGSEPSTTTNKLYNVSGSLYWNGSALGTAGSAGGWTVDGTTVHLVTGTDSVGIGTASPEGPLTIVSPSTSGWTPMLHLYAPNTSDGSHTAGIQYGRTNAAHDCGNLYFVSSPTDGEEYVSIGTWGCNDLLNIKGNGNVGIGVTDPDAKLEVNGQVKITGGTPGSGKVLTSDADGLATWETSGSSGWTDGGSNVYTTTATDKVGIGTTTPEFKLHLDDDGGILAEGTFLSGAALSTSGAGTRLIWYPRKAAFRAGSVDDTQWDDANIGYHSMAMGWYTKASGSCSAAMGEGTTASGYCGTAMGKWTTASGQQSTAMGNNSIASGEASTAMGVMAIASRIASTAMGWYAKASGDQSTAMGHYTTASGQQSTAMGISAKANHTGAIVIAANSSLTLSDSVRSGGDEQMVLRADGGIYITNIAGQAPYDASKLINTVTGGYLSSGGTWTDASSREYKENISKLSLEQAIEAFKKLKPVTYNYKVDKEEKCVGFIAEDVPDLVAVKGRRGLSPMDIVAVLTKVVQNQQQENEKLKVELAQLKMIVADLSERMGDEEIQMTSDK